MTMLHIHAEAITTGNPAYHEFLLYYRATEKIVYGFTEGKEDAAFYRGVIENSFSSGWTVKLIQAGNKMKVLQTYKDMDFTRFTPKRVCFFVDRDLSEFLEKSNLTAENIYTTEKYSIENEVVKIETFDRVLEEVLNITGMSPSEIDKIHSIFEKNMKLFKDAMVPIMAQIILWRRENKKPHLDSIDPKELFTFINGDIVLKSDFKTRDSRIAYAGKCCSLSCSSPELLIEVEKEFCSKAGPDKFIRGKYLLWFFVQCALGIHESIMNYCARYSKKPKVIISFGKPNALAIVGPRARTPDSLKTFIKLNYMEYIQAVGI